MAAKQLLNYAGFMPHGPNVPHGIRRGDTIDYSAIRPAKPDRTTDPDPGKQAEQAFENLRLLLEKEGLGFDAVTKVRVYVTKPEYIGPMNQVWYKHFPMETNPAARIVIGAAFLPGDDTKISLDVTAHAPAGR
ncbi:MAG: RidA family protein [SAR202 cluster bacterium]|nr:RidA family protein [SAR202 cluster bacterium]